STNITQFTAKLNALLQNNSTQQLIERGFVYNLASDTELPSIIDPQSTVVIMPATTAANYDSTIDNLEAGTAYRYRAFIRTNFGTYYGTIESFTTVPLSVKANLVQNLAVWPVPATSTLNFGNEVSNGGVVKIYNGTGKLVSETVLAEGETQLDLPSQLKAGQYLLLLNLNNGKVLKANFLKK
ncbi:MAG: T9SS type A sorting domain-containing protein, partial [Flexibacteraceae bacterium]